MQLPSVVSVCATLSICESASHRSHTPGEGFDLRHGHLGRRRSPSSVSSSRPWHRAILPQSPHGSVPEAFLRCRPAAWAFYSVDTLPLLGLQRRMWQWCFVPTRSATDRAVVGGASTARLVLEAEGMALAVVGGRATDSSMRQGQISLGCSCRALPQPLP